MPYLNSEQLQLLSERTMDKIDDLLEHLGVDIFISNSYYYGTCPVHGGDNTSAFNLYYNGKTYRGNWKCYTHQCERIFQPTILGLIRGILSHQKYGWENKTDQTVSFSQTLEFILKFLSIPLSKLQSRPHSNSRSQFSKIYTPPQNNSHNGKITRSQIRSLLTIPAEFYLKRGYSSQILDRYDVGLCTNPKKKMYQRVVTPIYDENYQHMIGCTGRSIFPKCEKCGLWHDISKNCPPSKYAQLYSKWKHSDGFDGQNSLYNYWLSKKHISQTGVAVVVESPGNVWKLEEAEIKNSVGLFGTSLSNGQQVLLDSAGTFTVVLLLDNDKGGQKGKEAFIENWKKYYNILPLFLPENKNDVGQMTVKEINDLFLPHITQAISDLGLTK